MKTMTNEPVILRCRSCRTLNRVPADKLALHPVCGQCKTTLAFPSIPVEASLETFDREIADWPEFVLVEFWAKWCGYCRMVEPVLRDLATWKAGKLKVLKVDVDAVPALAGRFQVRATPTFILYRNNRQLGRIDGAPQEKIELVRWVEGFLNSA